MKKLLVLTGESGSGKSSGMRHLEDLGFYCIDNIPPSLILNFFQLVKDNPEIEKAVLVTDIRNPAFRTEAKRILKELKGLFPEVEIWYFTADTRTLIKRFSETRRPHPFERYEPGKNLEVLIEEERKILEPVKQMADRIIDTSAMTPHDLKRFIKGLLFEGKSSLKVTVLSFGFKFGIPLTADNVFDVRFLPNPHFVPSLRSLTGKDEEVADYIFGFEESKKTFDSIIGYIRLTLPLYEKEGKAYVTFAVGCTGGQHRSVAFAEALAEEVAELFPDFETYVEHRELKERRRVKKDS